MSQTVLISKKRKRHIELATEEFFKWKCEPVESPIPGSSLAPRKKNVKTFYEEFCSLPSLTSPSSQRYQVSRSSLYGIVKKQKSEPQIGDFRMVVGRPTTLNSEEEANVIERCRQFEEEYGIITRFILKTEARQVALGKRDEAERNSSEVWEQEALLRFLRVGGDKWLRGFLKRHPEMTVSQTKRPIEKARAAKTQPEIVLHHYRNVAFTIALCQIQRKIASGVRVEGWILPAAEGLVTRENGMGRDPGMDILEVRVIVGQDGEDKEVIWVKPLAEPLEKLDPRLLAALDEKPIIPDCPTSEKISACGIRHMIGCNRSSTWTINPVILASGHLLASQLILRGASIGVDTLRKVSGNLLIHRHDNGVSSDKSWLEFAEMWMPKMQTSLENPGILVVDGHFSHLSRAFTRLAAKNNIYVICEPSNLSILLQTGDNGANAFIGFEYAREYSTMFALLNGAISIDHRIDAIARVMKKLRDKGDLIRHSFHTVRLTGDVMDCVGNWNPRQFAIGKQYRDVRLPKVTTNLLNAIFSTSQLVQPWGTAVVIPKSACTSIPPDLKASFQIWVKDAASSEQRERLGGSAIAYQLQRTEKTDKDLAVRLWGPKMEEWDSGEILAKKSKGRVYIAEGRCLFGDSACKESDDSEKKAEQVEKERIEKVKNKAVRQVHEAPIHKLLISLGLLEDGKFPTKKQLENFASLNVHLQWPTKFSGSQKREEQVEHILRLLETTESDTPFKGQ
jgi:hypothetical protein